MRKSMHHTLRGMTLTIGLLALGAGVTAAQGSDPGTRYDLKTETMLTGTIDGVMEVPGTGAMSGTHLSLETTSETIHVHLGPSQFVKKQGITFAKGDAVAVTGSRIKGDGYQAILARTVKRGSKAITLRDKNGMPRWGMRP